MIKTAKELAAACRAVATNYKTLYVLGCFGWPMTEENQRRAIKAQAFNRNEGRQEKIGAATADTFGFDCVNLIKGLLWGWDGDAAKAYGGAVYTSNGVPDQNADQMIDVCLDVTEDFSKIQVGEILWNKGHIGVYIGGGLAVECTYRWYDGVQITSVSNLGMKTGSNGRSWTKHGKLPYVKYEKEKGDYTMEMRNLKKGCTGEDVRALQMLLLGNGHDLGAAGADGIFGSKTDVSVRAYQKAKKLTEDGIAGKNTMCALLGVVGND